MSKSWELEVDSVFDSIVDAAWDDPEVEADLRSDSEYQLAESMNHGAIEMPGTGGDFASLNAIAEEIPVDALKMIRIGEIACAQRAELLDLLERFAS